jgi:hypothetical protein
MSIMNLAASPGGPGAPPRTITKRLLPFLLTGLLLIALVASLLPKGNVAAQEAAQEAQGSDRYYDSYYSENGVCYVQTAAATNLTHEEADHFVTAMDKLILKLGHHANYTFNNGTVTATVTVDCPPSGPSIEKVIFKNWIMPALATIGGLILVIASAVAITKIYKRIFNRAIQEQTVLANTITSFGGLLSTALLTYITSGGNWQATVAAGVSSFFTTYLVSHYTFQGLQDIVENWIAIGTEIAKNYALLAYDYVGTASLVAWDKLKETISRIWADAKETTVQTRA